MMTAVLGSALAKPRIELGDRVRVTVRGADFDSGGTREGKIVGITYGHPGYDVHLDGGPVLRDVAPALVELIDG